MFQGQSRERIGYSYYKIGDESERMIRLKNLKVKRNGVSITTVGERMAVKFGRKVEEKIDNVVRHCECKQSGLKVSHGEEFASSSNVTHGQCLTQSSD